MAGAHMTIRPMRGQVWVAKDKHDAGREEPLSSGIIIPATVHNPRKDKQHRGRVLLVGKPMQTKRGVEVPMPCKPGDEIIYVYALATERFRTIEVAEMHDGPIAVVAQAEVIGVVENG
jgi:co-chaperonin GroES (HSP10)